MKKHIALFLAIVMALSLAACSSDTDSTAGSDSQTVSFTVVVTDLEGTESTFAYTSDASTVGEALLEEGLIEGYEGPYGLTVETVNGITADWDADQAYWAFYIDGEYAMTGVDETDLADGVVYSFVLTQFSE